MKLLSGLCLVVGTSVLCACEPPPHVVLLIEDPSGVALTATELAVGRDGERHHRRNLHAPGFPVDITVLGDSVGDENLRVEAIDDRGTTVASAHVPVHLRHRKQPSVAVTLVGVCGVSLLQGQRCSAAQDERRICVADACVSSCLQDVTGDPSDSDGDGLRDPCDPCPNDPLDDVDVDGVCADVDLCPFVSDDQTDSDDDGVGDACDACPFDADDDSDRDGLCSDRDNCPTITNPEQEDADQDGVGDFCDNCQLTPNGPWLPDAGGRVQYDSDGDGFGDVCDPDVDNDGDTDLDDLLATRCAASLGQAGGVEDFDGNGTVDVTDILIAERHLNRPLGPSYLVDPGNDSDGDGVADAEDNCPYVVNADQADSDEFDSAPCPDGYGDVCDNCVEHPNGTSCGASAGSPQADTNGDGYGDICDTDVDDDGWVDSVDVAICQPCIASGSSSGTCRVCDFDGNGEANLDDAVRLTTLSDGPPGPAALAVSPLDLDGDGLLSAVDNCPTLCNPGQEDADGDGVGDLCE